jgi:hypothetical protein
MSLATYSLNVVPSPSPSTVSPPAADTSTTPPEVDQSPFAPQPAVSLQPSTSSKHHMITRFRDGTLRPKALLSTRYPVPLALVSKLQSVPAEPTSFTQASKDSRWRAAMLDEFNALLKNRTWSLVPYNPKMNVVGKYSLVRDSSAHDSNCLTLRPLLIRGSEIRMLNRSDNKREI